MAEAGPKVKNAGISVDSEVASRDLGSQFSAIIDLSVGSTPTNRIIRDTGRLVELDCPGLARPAQVRYTMRYALINKCTRAFERERASGLQTIRYSSFEAGA